MSYREIRNFTEMMRALGYPRLISVDNFRNPNFALVAHILYWLVERYDPDIRISDNIESEDDRVEFISNVTQAMMVKARIKLNAKKLYAADGYAVKELLKVASVLYSALRSNLTKGEEEDNEPPASLGSRAQDVKVARILATEITEKGARLHDLLGQEAKLQQARTKAFRFLDSISGNLQSTSEYDYIEKSIRDSISSLQNNMEVLKKQCADLEADEKALESKIKKKQTDLERGEKRLKSLQTVRPAFMDEYEKLEKELQRQYEIYLGRYRNLDYLEHELDLYDQAEREKLEQSERQLKRMQKRLRDEELKLLRGEQDLKDDDGDVPRPRPLNSGGQSRPSASSAGSRGGRSQVQGSMAARSSGAEEEESGSEGSEEGSKEEEEASGSEGEEVSVGGSQSGDESGSELVEDDQEDSGEGSDEEGGSNEFGSQGSAEDF